MNIHGVPGYITVFWKGLSWILSMTPTSPETYKSFNVLVTFFMQLNVLCQFWLKFCEFYDIMEAASCLQKFLQVPPLSIILPCVLQSSWSPRQHLLYLGLAPEALSWLVGSTEAWNWVCHCVHHTAEWSHISLWWHQLGTWHFCWGHRNVSSTPWPLSWPQCLRR